MALLRTPSHELNSPSLNEISTDNAKQSVLLEKPKSERLHQLPPSTDEISTDNAEQSVYLDKPENEQLHQLRSPRREIYFISAKIALVLIFTISYHTFCFIVHYRSIPIGRSGNLGPSFLHCEQYHSQGHPVVADCPALSSSQHSGCHHNCSHFICLCRAVAHDGCHRRDQGTSDYFLSLHTVKGLIRGLSS